MTLRKEICVSSPSSASSLTKQMKRECENDWTWRGEPFRRNTISLTKRLGSFASSEEKNDQEQRHDDDESKSIGSEARQTMKIMSFMPINQIESRRFSLSLFLFAAENDTFSSSNR